MLKKLLAGVLLSALVIIGLLGCSSGQYGTEKKSEEKTQSHSTSAQEKDKKVSASKKADKASTNKASEKPTAELKTPLDTVRLYGSLIADKKFDQAAKLQTADSQKKFTGAVLEAAKEDIHGGMPTFYGAFPPMVDKDLAVAAILNMVAMGNEPTPMVDIIVLKEHPQTKKWEVINDIGEIAGPDKEKEFIQLLKNLIKLDEFLQKADLAKDGLNENQVKSVKAQADAMLEAHKGQLASIEGQKK